ncbi:hypothetical protein SOVF_180380, partial [Spinacia oleracea]
QNHSNSIRINTKLKFQIQCYRLIMPKVSQNQRTGTYLAICRLFPRHHRSRFISPSLHSLRRRCRSLSRLSCCWISHTRRPTTLTPLRFSSSRIMGGAEVEHHGYHCRNYGLSEGGAPRVIIAGLTFLFFAGILGLA